MRENTTFEPKIQPGRTYEGVEEIPGGRKTKPTRTADLKEKARPMMARRKRELADRIRDTAQVLRETGDNLASREKPGGDYVHRAAERLDRYSAYLQDTPVDSIVDDVQRFGRERPWITIGGAFLLGVAVARFLKSSQHS